MTIINVSSKSDFTKNVINNTHLVLVDFWAQWCPPCHAMAPILEKTADAMKNVVVVVKVDIESSPDAAELATQYEVQGIPNMVLFRDGKPIDRIIGMVSYLGLQEILEKHTQ